MLSRERVYGAEALVLRRRNIGEADSIFTLFSPDRGRFELVARGVRKARSRMRGHLEPLTHVRVQAAHGRTLDVLTQAETIHAYRALREDLDRLPHALYCAELLDRFTVELGRDPLLFDLVLAVFDAMEAGAGPHIVRLFEVQLLAETGFDLQLDGCAACRSRLAEEETLFSPGSGGLVCRRCRPTAASGRLLSVRAVKVLRFARGGDLGAFASLRIDAELARELELALGDAVRYVLDREPSTARYIDEMERARSLA